MSIDAVIVDVVHTPSGKGKEGGALAGVHPADLFGGVIRDLLARNGIEGGQVDDVIGGCVTQIGEQSTNITRTAALSAGLPDTVPAVTIDRQCGSSQQAATFAAQGVMTGMYDIVVAGGVESMSRVKILSNAAGKKTWGSSLEERYPGGLVDQGISAELIIAEWGLTRDDLDAFAARSHERAAAAAARGDFDDELVSVETENGTFAADETIRPGTTVESLAGLRSAFHTDAFAERFPEARWQITAGNSSPLTDGASAALIMSEQRAAQLGLKPRARFHSFAVTGSDPLLMLTGVIPATRRILERSGLTLDEMDAYEVNEAFAPVPIIWQRELGADPEKLNSRGGAIALGHPLGATGAKLLATLLNTLESTGGRYGLQVMCEGGGMANATIIERL